MPQSYTCLHYHIIFSTKNRAPLIDADLQERLYPYLGGILTNHDASPIAMGGMPDHVHILASLHAQTAVAEMLRLIKANSSRWIHETFPDRRQFAWQSGYAAFSVSHSNVPRVEEYIASQPEHHRASSFQDELLAFLKRHDVPYDERYIFA